RHIGGLRVLCLPVVHKLYEGPASRNGVSCVHKKHCTRRKLVLGGFRVVAIHNKTKPRQVMGWLATFMDAAKIQPVSASIPVRITKASNECFNAIVGVHPHRRFGSEQGDDAGGWLVSIFNLASLHFPAHEVGFGKAIGADAK